MTEYEFYTSFWIIFWAIVIICIHIRATKTSKE